MDKIDRIMEDFGFKIGSTYTKVINNIDIKPEEVRDDSKLAFNSRESNGFPHSTTKSEQPITKDQQMAKNNEIIEALVEALSPKKAKKNKAAKYVIVVNNRVMDQRPTSKKELKQAIVAISLSNPTANITVFKDPVEVTVDLPVSGIDFGEV